LVAAVLAVSCAPTQGSPELPRPAPTTSVGMTTTTLVTTTTILVETSTVTDCPTEFCVVYSIRPEARWSDGVPVTSEDFAYSADVLAAAGVPGHDLVRSVTALDRTTAVVALDLAYGSWRGLFPRVFRSGGPLIGDPSGIESTGPFTVAGWQEGEFLVLERNEPWWVDQDPLSGEPVGDLSEVTLVFIDDPAAMVAALAAGEVDVIAVRPDQATIASLETLEGVEYAVAPGPFWEHIDFHHEDPMLAQLWVRRAIALAIDRERILDETVRLTHPSATILDNTVWMTTTPYYEPHYDVGFDPDGAERILVENGCARGDDGIQICDGTRLSFLWSTTDDDPARRATFDLVRVDLEAIGVELVAAFVSPSELASRNFLFGGPERWQMINFSWKARPDPAAANATYYCGGESLNVSRYCSEEVESLIRSTDTIIDPDERAAVYNQADRIYLEDLAVIPLYQKPMMMAWRAELSGPAPNYTLASHLWNVGAWRGQESIVVAIPAEPDTLDPASVGDDSANLVLGSMLYGAFGMDPNHQTQPVLVDSVELIGTGG
jgi:peptide/nickel transport system substrate-binding protein